MSTALAGLQHQEYFSILYDQKSCLISLSFVLADASEGSKLVLHGRHNADRGWISDIRMKGNALVR